MAVVDGSDWTLALEQQTDLAITAGNVSELATAVRRGADLRLYMTTEWYEETIYFQQTYAGEGDAVAGLMSHHHGYTHHRAEVDQPNMSIFKYDVSGTYEQIKWLWGDVANDDGQAYPYGIYRWFVCDRWRVVYEHDADGNRLGGDLDELAQLIREGRTVQVGIRQLFSLAEDRQDGPDHISFVTTMQPLIQDGHARSNCDLVVVGAPKWPFTWKNGVHVALLHGSCRLTLPVWPGDPVPLVNRYRRGIADGCPDEGQGYAEIQDKVPGEELGSV